MERVRLAVAGAGAFGREHLKRLAVMDGVEIAGVADTDPAAARRAAEQHGIRVAAADAVAMVGEFRPDGLVVATPGHTHLPIALAALGLGIPVLVEKPIGLDAAEAARLMAAEAAGPAWVLPGHVLRFSAHHRMLLDIVRSPAVGAVLGFTSRRHRDDSHAVRYPEIDPVLMTMIHDIDLAIWMTGAGAASAYALRRPEGRFRSDTLMLASGAAGAAWHLTTAWTFPDLQPPPDRVEVVGEYGGVELEVEALDPAVRPRGEEIDLAASPRTRSPPSRNISRAASAGASRRRRLLRGTPATGSPAPRRCWPRWPAGWSRWAKPPALPTSLG
ncbi:MAG: Gfo/Idh/MocA family oxidoreductase [Dongiaceae bacterium]